LVTCSDVRQTEGRQYPMKNRKDFLLLSVLRAGGHSISKTASVPFLIQTLSQVWFNAKQEL